MRRRALVVGLLLLARPPAVIAGKGVEGVVNLNTAPAPVLAMLPGVGPSKAGAIVAYRQRRPFRTVDELVRIKGIGRKMVRRLRPHLAISGPTTAVAAPASPAPGPPPKPPPPATRAPPAAHGLPPRPLRIAGRPRREHRPTHLGASPCLGGR